MASEARSLRRGRALMALLVLLALTASGAAAAGPFSLPGLRGDSFSDREAASGATVIVVWASWSPRCRGIGGQANALLERWSGQARVVTVNFQEERDAAQAFAGQEGLRAPVYLDQDGEFAKAFGVTNLPGLLVLRDGQAVFSGRLSPEADEVIAERLR